MREPDILWEVVDVQQQHSENLMDRGNINNTQDTERTKKVTSTSQNEKELSHPKVFMWTK